MLAESKLRSANLKHFESDTTKDVMETWKADKPMLADTCSIPWSQLCTNFAVADRKGAFGGSSPKQDSLFSCRAMLLHGWPKSKSFKTG